MRVVACRDAVGVVALPDPGVRGEGNKELLKIVIETRERPLGCRQVALVGDDYIDMKPTMLVKPGDKVLVQPFAGLI